jgi:hypothetical protein
MYFILISLVSYCNVPIARAHCNCNVFRQSLFNSIVFTINFISFYRLQNESQIPTGSDFYHELEQLALNITK